MYIIMNIPFAVLNCTYLDKRIITERLFEIVIRNKFQDLRRQTRRRVGRRKTHGGVLRDHRIQIPSPIPVDPQPGWVRTRARRRDCAPPLEPR